MATDQHFTKGEMTQQDARPAHVVHTFRSHAFVQLSVREGEPVYSLLVDSVIVPCPIWHYECLRLEKWVTACRCPDAEFCRATADRVITVEPMTVIGWLRPEEGQPRSACFRDLAFLAGG